MKTITFFNEKGGVGKSSFAIMYASWLHYVHGLKVAVVDFNDRLTYYRNDEVNFRSDLDKDLIKEYEMKMNRYNELVANGGSPFKPKEPLLSWERVKSVDVWPIVVEDPVAITQMKKTYEAKAYSMWVKNLIANNQLDYDVVIYDFAGSIEDKKFLSLLAADMINLIVVPVDRDQQTINSSVRTVNLINNPRFKGRMHCEFLNQVNMSNKKNVEYNKQAIETLTDKCNFKFLPDMISFSERMKKIAEVDIMRSNFEYPSWGVGAFKDSEDIGIDNLFIDITKLLATTNDILNTSKTDFSFVESLQKKTDPSRQFAGSSFPEFEM